MWLLGRLACEELDYRGDPGHMMVNYYFDVHTYVEHKARVKGERVVCVCVCACVPGQSCSRKRSKSRGSRAG